MLAELKQGATIEFGFLRCTTPRRDKWGKSAGCLGFRGQVIASDLFNEIVG